MQTFNVQRPTPNAQAGRTAAPWTLHVERWALNAFPAGSGQSRPTRAGFTLMEMLLAIAVSAIVLSVVTTTYFSALQLRNRTTKAIDDALPLQHALATIKRDLTALIPPGGTFGGELQSTPTTETASTMTPFANGQRVSPDFTTASGLVDEYTPFADVQRVSYYLVDPTNNSTAGRDLMRVRSRNLLPATVDEPSAQWLMGGVETVTFQFYNGFSWQETWDSTTSSNLPTAIKLQLVPAAEFNQPNQYLQTPIELVVPIVVQAGTNQTQTTGGGS